MKLSDEASRMFAEALHQDEPLTDEQKRLLAWICTKDPLDNLAKKMWDAAAQRLLKDGITSYEEVRQLAK